MKRYAGIHENYASVLVSILFQKKQIGLKQSVCKENRISSILASISMKAWVCTLSNEQQLLQCNEHNEFF